MKSWQTGIRITPQHAYHPIIILSTSRYQKSLSSTPCQRKSLSENWSKCLNGIQLVMIKSDQLNLMSKSYDWWDSSISNFRIWYICCSYRACSMPSYSQTSIIKCVRKRWTWGLPWVQAINRSGMWIYRGRRMSPLENISCMGKHKTILHLPRLVIEAFVPVSWQEGKLKTSIESTWKRFELRLESRHE